MKPCEGMSVPRANPTLWKAPSDMKPCECNSDPEMKPVREESGPGAYPLSRPEMNPCEGRVLPRSLPPFPPRYETLRGKRRAISHPEMKPCEGRDGAQELAYKCQLPKSSSLSLVYGYWRGGGFCTVNCFQVLSRCSRLTRG